jgi:transposase-like protein
MSASRKSYDSEYKREAVRLADGSEKGDSAVGRELGLYQGAIRTWRKALHSDSVNS